MNMVTMIVAAVVTVLVMMLAAKAIQTGPESEGNDRYLTKSHWASLSRRSSCICATRCLFPSWAPRRPSAPAVPADALFLHPDQQPAGHDSAAGHSAPAWDSRTPIIGTATGNLNITAGLATISFFIIIAHAIKDLGWKGFLEHMTGGLHKEHWSLWPVVAAGVRRRGRRSVHQARGGTIRLFANMVAGHTLMAVLMGFGAMAARGGMSWWEPNPSAGVRRVGRADHLP